MLRHLTVNLLMIVVTIVVGVVLYPVLVMGMSYLLAPQGRTGSLLMDGDKVVGSSLIAQEFKDPGYFQPRPSAANYDAGASGGSNLAVSNPKLRDRVARQIATQVRYASGPKKGQGVATDVEGWFAKEKNRAAKWAENNPRLAKFWLEDDSRKKQVAAWCEAHTVSPAKPEDLPKEFFKVWSEANPGTWPVADDKGLSAIKTGQAVVETFFDSWLQARGTNDDLTRVPADLVTASGSGLDPHITLKGARFQLPVVAEVWAKKLNQPEASVSAKLDALLVAESSPPFGFLGEPLVNVLEVNRKIAATLK
jgi:K+-transporting ATPase ATPase C chain